MVKCHCDDEKLHLIDLLLIVTRIFKNNQRVISHKFSTKILLLLILLSVLQFAQGAIPTFDDAAIDARLSVALSSLTIATTMTLTSGSRWDYRWIAKLRPSAPHTLPSVNSGQYLKMTLTETERTLFLLMTVIELRQAGTTVENRMMVYLYEKMFEIGKSMAHHVLLDSMYFLSCLTGLPSCLFGIVKRSTLIVSGPLLIRRQDRNLLVDGRNEPHHGIFSQDFGMHLFKQGSDLICDFALFQRAERIILVEKSQMVGVCSLLPADLRRTTLTR
jgi:hypothetical protein